MTLLRALAIAFSTYSKIPMPQFAWADRDMRYTMGFFPLIGAVIGALAAGWFALSRAVGFGAFFTGAVAALIPLFVSGGIHLDGYADTVDALSSHQGREKKLEILKDPHAGAFASIFTAAYLVLYAGILGEVGGRAVPVIGIGYALSRSLSALAVVRLKNARTSGMLNAFSRTAEKKNLTVVLILWIILCAAAMLAAGGWSGALALVGAAIAAVYYRVMAYRQFGGVTGDLAGYFLTLCELLIALGALIGLKIGGGV